MQITSSNVLVNLVLCTLLAIQSCTSSLVVAPRTLPYRGKVIENGESSEEIYRIYQEKLHEYKNKAFHDTNWQTLKRTDDDIEVSILTSEDDQDCPYVRLRAVMPTSAKKLQRFMGFSNWKIFMPIINPFYQGMSVMKEYSFGKVKMVMARKRSTRILGFGRRDFSLLSVMEDILHENEDVLMSGTISVIAPQQIPRYEGFTRAYQDMVCFYKSVGSGSDERTELTIILRTDLNDSSDGGTGGKVPMWLVVKTLGVAGSKAMQGLRNVVTKHVSL